MTGNEFIEKVKRLAEKRDLPFKVEDHLNNGKNSRSIRFGRKRVAIPDIDKQLGDRFIEAACDQLDISLHDFEQS